MYCISSDEMQTDLKFHSDTFIFSEVVKLDVTKVNEVRQLARQYRKTSGVLVHISAMEFKVYVIAVEYEKMSQALHQVKVSELHQTDYLLVVRDSTLYWKYNPSVLHERLTFKAINYSFKLPYQTRTRVLCPWYLAM